MTQNPAIGDHVIPGPPSRQRPQDLRAPSVAAPASVTAAVAAHQRVIDEFTEASAALKDAERAAGEAYKQDILADAELVAAGKKRLPAEKRTEPKAQHAVQEATRRVAVAAAAGSKTQAALTEAVIAACDGWLVDLRAQEAEAAEAFTASLAALRESARTLQATRGAAAWLGNVDADRRELPNHVSTGRLNALVGSREFPVADLFAALDALANPPAPQPRMAGKLGRQPRTKAAA